MHLVFVTSLVPDGAPSTGYEIANAAIIAALRRQGVRVTVLGYVRPGEMSADPDNTVVLGSLDPTNDNASAQQKLLWVAKALASGLTVSSAKLRLLTDEAFKSALDSVDAFDGYVLNAVQMSAAYEDVLKDRPALFVAHNVEHISAQQNAQQAKSSLQRWLFTREARLLGEIERRLCNQARFVFTLTEADRHALGVSAPGKSATLPLVTRPNAPVPTKNRQITCDAGLIGTWTWQPNRVGLEWFLTEVVPHLDSGFRISIAGSVPQDIVSRHQDIHFAGRVGDAEEFVTSAAIVPLVSRAGTGVQLKTIETFELGLPAVATSSATRGISKIPGNCTVTDDPKVFADAMMRAARDRPAPADGSLFFRAQMQGLDESVSTGLKMLGFERQAVPA